MRTLQVCALVFAVALGGCVEKKKSESKSETAASATAVASATAKPKPKKEKLPPPANVAAPPKDAEVTASGLASIVLKKGTGTEHPFSKERVKVHYTGWTKDGDMFDSSVTRKRPATFGLNRVIKGWTEGVQLMTAGEKRRFWIPGKLAYGEKSSRAGAPSGQLTFDIELLELMRAADPPKPPAELKSPPADAKKLGGGLAYKVLTKGTGTVHPKPQQKVKVHYTGWTTEGKIFDSSVIRGRPASFGLDRVIKGWTVGVQKMVVGESAVFWIPGEMAYGDKPARPGAPAGPLIFQIELLEIVEPRTAPNAAKTPAKGGVSAVSGTKLNKPAAAKPVAPKPAAAKPVAPKPAAAKPVAPKPVVQPPTPPKPAAKPVAPQPPAPPKPAQ